jgi:hypothetical protein
MKNIIFIIFLSIFFISNVSSEINEKKCDNIENKSKKIECLTNLKTDIIKEKSIKKLEIVNQKIKNFETSKTEFDKKNSSLLDMWKNYRK